MAYMPNYQPKHSKQHHSLVLSLSGDLLSWDHSLKAPCSFELLFLAIDKFTKRIKTKPVRKFYTTTTNKFTEGVVCDLGIQTV